MYIYLSIYLSISIYRGSFNVCLSGLVICFTDGTTIICVCVYIYIYIYIRIYIISYTFIVANISFFLDQCRLNSSPVLI